MKHKVKSIYEREQDSRKAEDLRLKLRLILSWYRITSDQAAALINRKGITVRHYMCGLRPIRQSQIDTLARLCPVHHPVGRVLNINF